jgi:DNA-binding PadR family transcriptional regulator
MRHVFTSGGPGGLRKHRRHGAMRHRHGMHDWGRFEGRGWGPPGGGGKRRMRRGDVRAAVLVLLDEGPQTGYGLMGEIENRSEGAWRPSPGSMYPTLTMLEEEGLIRPQAGEGRTPYELTDEGRAYVEEHREKLGQPWARSTEGFGGDRLELRRLIGQLGAAAFQVGTAGDDAQIAQAKDILTETRRALYRILADEAPNSD